jgi:DNA-directed RNA polymerase specialized sigma24 family protein
VSMALLVVLETMTPAERVAFVLHDVFSYPYNEIGDVVGQLLAGLPAAGILRASPGA